MSDSSEPAASHSPSSWWRRLLSAVLLLTVAIGGLYWVLKDVPVAELHATFVATLDHLHPVYLLVSAAAYAGLIFVHAWRFSVVVHSATPMRLRSGFVAYTVANLINIIVPAHGGDLYKGHYVSRQTGLGFVQVMGLATVDLALWGFTLLLVMSGAALADDGFLGQVPHLRSSLAAIGVGGLLGALALAAVSLTFGRSIKAPGNRLMFRTWQFLHGFGEALKPRTVPRVIAVSVIGWALEAAIPYFLSAALGQPLTILQSFWAMVAVTIALAVPSPGGVGPWEVAAAYIFGLAGANKAQAFLFATLYHLIFILMSALLGLLGLLLVEKRPGAAISTEKTEAPANP